MNWIKVKNKDGKEVLINLDKVTHFFENTKTSTTIIFSYEDYIVVDLPISFFESGLSSINDIGVVHLFTKQEKADGI